MLQTIVVGLVQGGVYALCAAGLVLIFSVAGVANLAHGETVVFGGLVAYAARQFWHLPYVVAIGVGAVAAAALGLVFCAVVFDRLRHAAEEGYLVASLGLIFIMEAVSTRAFGDEPRAVPGAPQHVHQVAGVRLPTIWVVILVTAVVLIALLRLLISRTTPGRAMRAMALNPYAAALMGISRRKYSFVAFGIGSLVAGVAGGLLASAFPLSATSGEDLAFKSFVVIIVAGIGSIGGALLGGVVIGVVGAIAAGYISSGYANTLIFSCLLLILILRPNGLFGVSLARD